MKQHSCNSCCCCPRPGAGVPANAAPGALPGVVPRPAVAGAVLCRRAEVLHAAGGAKLAVRASLPRCNFTLTGACLPCMRTPAGDPASTDTCQGDSGGPIFLKGANATQDMLVGVRGGRTAGSSSLQVLPRGAYGTGPACARPTPRPSRPAATSPAGGRDQLGPRLRRGLPWCLCRCRICSGLDRCQHPGELLAGVRAAWGGGCAAAAGLWEGLPAMPSVQRLTAQPLPCCSGW